MKTAVKKFLQDRICRCLMFVCLSLFLWAFLSVGATAYGAVWYVKISGSDSNAGTSWEEPFGTIQAAVNAAIYGDEIWVEEGTYTLSAPIDIHNSISLYGGFAGTETERRQRDWRNQATMVDGGNQVYHCFYVETPFSYYKPRIDGFTITRGNASYTGSSENGSGGGIYNNQAATTIANCTFTGNIAHGYTRGGGAIFVHGVDAPTIINCAFYGNQAIGDGVHGGAIHIDSSNPAIVNCVFSGNSTGFYGGAIFINGNTPAITNCSFTGNNAAQGGAVYSANSAEPIITNCIFWGDTVALGNSADGPEIYDEPTSQSHVYHCDAQGGGTPGQTWYQNGAGNINQDPLFLNADSDDLRIPYDSPCVDQGDGNALPADGADLDEDGDQAELVPVDIAGSRRAVGTVDMGAYEYKKVWYVDGNAAASGNGMSWSEAFQTIQEAVDAAQAGHEIWVKAGNYLIGQPIAVNRQMALYGGFDGTEMVREARNWATRTTTVDGQGAVHHCFLVTEHATIDGFVVTGGRADGTETDSRGGGIYIDTCGADVFNCILSNNNADLSGGGIYTVGTGTIANCLMYGNSAINGGGMAGEGASVTIINCTISTNDATNGGGFWANNSNPAINNSIIWGNTATAGPALYREGVSTPVANHSLIQGATGQSWFDDGTGNLDVDPLFVDVPAGDFHLQLTSPCIDAGDNGAVPAGITLDFDGNPRVADGNEDYTETVDMGVDEYIHIPVTWYVDGTASTSGDGTSWAEAFINLEEALENHLLRNFDQIWVKQGTYSPSGLSIWSYQGLPVEKFVLLFGGFPAGVSTPGWTDRDWQAYPTIIDAQASENHAHIRCLKISGAVNVYHQNRGYPVIDGFVVTGGDYGEGGGIYIQDRAPTISNCIITGNYSLSSGGGMCLFNALPESTVFNCLISGNKSPYGGAISSVGDYHSNLVNCTITGNITSGASDTGTIYITPMNRDEFSVINTIIWGNFTESGVPTIYFNSSNSNWPYRANFINSDIEGASSESWFNHSDGIPGNISGNIDTYPLFAVSGHWDDNGTPEDPEDDFWVEGDYRLQDGSPCMDSGDDASVPPDMNDLDGDGDTIEAVPFDLAYSPRFISTVNMGAYETPAAPPGDLDGDGIVDSNDLVVLAPDFGADDCGGETSCAGDLDGDGDTDGLDLAAFASVL